MAEWLQSLVLALIQGVTEFLPVSSSAHLILPSRILGWPDQGILFDVGVHAGTLCAVLWYFRATLASWFASLLPGRDREGSELWPVVIATVPVVLAGWLLRDMIANEARGVPVIIATTVIFGFLLGVADRRAPDAAAGRSYISGRDALLIGSAQVLALIPGTSRSGITITAALFLGYHRPAAARFSFLLSMPVIAGALLLMLVASPDTPTGPAKHGNILMAFAVSATFAYGTIHLFMDLVERIGLMPFVVYRMLLGLALWVWVTQGI